MGIYLKSILFIQMYCVISVNHLHLNALDTVFAESLHCPLHELFAKPLLAVLLQNNQIIQLSIFPIDIYFTKAYNFFSALDNSNSRLPFFQTFGENI